LNDVRVTTVLDVDPQAAFRIFTEDVDAWWGRGPRFRWAPGREGTLRFEPEAAGTRSRWNTAAGLLSGLIIPRGTG
jgi:hypothetical protein